MSSGRKMRIALVHDALCVSGGAERLVLWLSKAFPEAPIYTSVYLPENTFPEYKNLDVRTLPGAKLIKSEKMFKLLFPYWLWQIQRVDFSEFDLVLSSSTYLAKYINPSKEVKHYSYLHAPFRLLWKPSSYSKDSLPTPGIIAPLIKRNSHLLQSWDRRRTQEISRVATSCNNVANEISDIYKIKAEIISPPIAISEYSITDHIGDYFLSVSRLISHKRVDIAIQACNLLKKKLIIIGEGPERNRLERMAGNSIYFLGKIPEAQLKEYYANARALIFPSHEDYGIVPLEAQACGLPVIAYGKGGVLETVEKDVSGLFFQEQTADSLMKALLQFETSTFDKNEIRKWTAKFDGKIFISKIQELVNMP